MAVDVELDVELLKCEIKKTYASVSDKDFIFPTGRAWALDLGYPADLLARVPDGAAESFAVTGHDRDCPRSWPIRTGAARKDTPKRRLAFAGPGGTEMTGDCPRS
jgi:hypothetical protein